MKRFHVRVSGKLTGGSWAVKLDRKSKYYHCPVCEARTLIGWQRLDIFNPEASPFPESLLKQFGETPEFKAAFDFYCRGCTRPVRLLFWAQERGMGGYWYPFITSVLELDTQIR